MLSSILHLLQDTLRAFYIHLKLLCHHFTLTLIQSTWTLSHSWSIPHIYSFIHLKYAFVNYWNNPHMVLSILHLLQVTLGYKNTSMIIKKKNVARRIYKMQKIILKLVQEWLGVNFEWIIINVDYFDSDLKHIWNE